MSNQRQCPDFKRIFANLLVFFNIRPEEPAAHRIFPFFPGTTLRLYIGVPVKIYLRVLLCPFCVPFFVEFDLIISPFFTFVGAVVYVCFFVSGLKTLAKNPDRFGSYSIPTIIPCVE